MTRRLTALGAMALVLALTGCDGEEMTGACGDGMLRCDQSTPFDVVTNSLPSAYSG